MKPRSRDYLRDLQQDVQEVRIQQEDNDGLITESSAAASPRIVPLELGDGGAVDELAEDTSPLFDWNNPWYPLSFVNIFLGFPVSMSFIFLFYNLFGRIWVSSGFCLHLFALSFHTWSRVRSNSRFTTMKSIGSFLLLLDILVFVIVYPIVAVRLIDAFFLEPDGTYVPEWTRHLRVFQVCRVLSVAMGIFLLLVWLLSSSCFQWRQVVAVKSRWQGAYPLEVRLHKQVRYQRLSVVCLLVALALLIWSIVSTIIHLPSWEGSTVDHAECDPLDTHECVLPFPSMYHLIEDDSTETGYRVNLRRELLPPMKGGIEMHPEFLNELDGFSTMGPILFYMDRLKEAHEVGKAQLRGHPDFQFSTQQGSVTLLFRVHPDGDAGTLVEHSAEIDYLDPDNPLVMIFPARPLHHNAHYALAVVGAVDEHGELLPRTDGLHNLLHDNASNPRRERFMGLLLPSLLKAAPWVSSTSDVQLLFDFHTVSESSQLGPIRAVRDGTLSYLETKDWHWKEHVRVNSIWDDEDACASDDGSGIRRIVNAEVDVPWFLSEIGLRSSFLNMNAVEAGEPVGLGTSKFIVQVPCTVYHQAVDPESPRGKFTGVLEYGHGLFGNRFESRDSYIPPILNANGYVLVAMDWRGMCQFDLPIVIRVLLSSPRTFRAVRDNLIQGFAAKHAMIHFVRSALLDMDWMKFSVGSSSLTAIPPPEEPRFVFYGNSQGGILGAGYSVYSHARQLLDSAILGVPGTPFALIMSRSLDFQGYDALLLLSFYKNRHIRILLSLMQMGWDPVEGSGVLAPPVSELPGPTLLQAGLGDAIVTTIAAEALARAMNASVLPNAPRAPYGLEEVSPDDDAERSGADDIYLSSVVFTEIQYEAELSSLPVDDFFAAPNPVHVCARRDPAFRRQIDEFLITGRALDICSDGSCVRANASLICH